MIKVLIRPSKSLFGGRRQWKFEIRAANGRRIDPRDTYANRTDIINIMYKLLENDDIELVLYDRFGEVETRKQLR